MLCDARSSPLGLGGTELHHAEMRRSHLKSRSLERGSTILIFGIAGVAAGLLSTLSRDVLPLIGGLVLLVILAQSGWRVRLTILVVAVSINRFSIQVLGVDVRADQVVPLILALCLVAEWQNKRSPHLPSVVPLVALTMLGVAASQIAGTDLVVAGRFAVQILTGVILFVVVLQSVRDEQLVRSVTSALLVVASVQGLLGVLAFLNYLATGNSLGIDVPLSGLALARGTMFEGNIFGSFMAASLLVALGAQLEAKGWFNWRSLAITLIAAGLVLSFTRAAWLGFVIGLIFLIVGSKQALSSRMRLALYAGSLSLVGVIALTLLPSIGERVEARSETLFDFSSGSGYGRVRLAELAVREWRQEPWIGLGWGSFSGRLPGQSSVRRSWIPNLSLAILHDTGVLGAILLVWALLRTVAFRSRRALLVQAHGYVAAFIAVLIAAQATSGFILGLFWFFFGMAGASIAASKTFDNEVSDPGNHLAILNHLPRSGVK